MSKENTLFSYFSKSPKVNQASNKGSDATGVNGKKGTTPLKRKDKCAGDSASLSPKVNCAFKLHDLVWAKLEGYPFWPALVCNPPNESSFLDRAKAPSVHVQFFDTPPSRGWVKLRRLKMFTGPSHMEVPKMKDVKWIKGVQEAEKALAMGSDERSHLVSFVESNSRDAEDSEMGVVSGGSDEDADEEAKENCESPQKPSLKKRRIIMASDSEESDDEFKPGKNEASESDSESSGVDENALSEPDPETDEGSPVKATPKQAKRKRNANAGSTPSSSQKSTPVRSSQESTRSKLLSFSSPKAAPKSDVLESQPASGAKVWAHLTYDFLKEGKRRDAGGHLPSHPDFNPRSLQVPESFRSKLSPAMKQWWDMKSQHFDVVLFFKVGKFYELYHMDAVTGVEELGLVYMKGDFAHSGFPEISYGRYSESLIQKGYKVARVEQTETPQMMEDRCKKSGTRTTKFDKVVKREICRITSKGTRMFSVHDGQVCDAMPSFLFAFAEASREVGGRGGSEFGVCFVDTSVGKFYLGQFEDDHFCSKLRTTVSHYSPVQVLYENHNVTAKARQVLDGPLCSVTKEGLRPWKEFWDATKTLKSLREGGYFEEEDGSYNYPEALKHFIDPEDKMLLTPKEEGCLALKALGACIWYLSESLIEEEVLTMRSFELYTPQETSIDRIRMEQLEKEQLTVKNLILDGVSLQNLEVLRNTTGGLDGTLLGTMDFCCTQFGKRLFLQWLCSPCCQASVIEDRQKAVQDLLSIPNEAKDVCKLLKSLPDLERLLTKVHTQGLARKNKDHPDFRAILYEDTTYNKRKIGNLLLALQGFKTAVEVVDTLSKVRNEFSSATLSRCVSTAADGGSFPELGEALEFFDNAFDHEEAKKNGKVTPSKGVDKDYDDAMRRVKAATRDLEDYLETQCRHFKCKATYHGTGKNRFQIEVPESASRLAGAGYELQGQRKGFKRYWTSRVKELAAHLVSAEEAQEAAIKDIMRRIFESFDRRRQEWEVAVQCLAVLDCLLSLAQYSASLTGTACTPRILRDGEPRLSIQGGRHPCLLKHLGGENLIPNSIALGDYEDDDSAPRGARLALVTGPNMGGKSTLMRQAGLLVIIAQMGAKVPAESCELTLVDRIFTRLGASDRITSGESTFFVEVNETSAILRHATRHSLVLLDELGRGTSTHDGMSIAHAVVKELSTKIHCRTLFSTHYHHLVEGFTSDPNVYLGHMACMVENENEDDPTQETIVFLYKFARGACPKSYGFNAAKLAGIPPDIIKRAFCKSKSLEKRISLILPASS
ncbi:DNA mismatch repair protein Msh6 [Ixodes scapularis]|uniref:DNA mismatch repair protein Msh6 n=1 Tax=Ixodes scapularis TaxID=6945 RepID=UPI001C39057C|nr:DNA mismatch repair protein Msh6 [Ixodes scapularis]